MRFTVERHFVILCDGDILEYSVGDILELATFLNSPIQEYLQLVRSNTSIKQQVNNIAIELVSSYLTKVEYYFIDVEGLEKKIKKLPTFTWHKLYPEKNPLIIVI